MSLSVIKEEYGRATAYILCLTMTTMVKCQSDFFVATPAMATHDLKVTFGEYPAIRTNNTVYQTAPFQTTKIYIDLVISW